MVNTSFGRNNANTTNQYLRGAGDTPSNLNGFVLPFDATLVGKSMSEDVNTQTWTAEVRRNDSVTILDSLTITNQYENHDYTNDIDFNEGDRVQVYLNGTSINYPSVTLFFRRRI